MVRPPRVVLTYGRFDLFHQGHVAFLQRISQLADDVIVGCATDEHALACGTPCQVPYADRRAMLESCRYISRVIAQTDVNQKRTDIVNYNASTLAMGEECLGKYDHLQNIAQILYLPRVPVRLYASNSREYRTAAGF